MKLVDLETTKKITQADIVATCEDLLIRAKEGKLQQLFTVMLTTEGEIRTSHASSCAYRLVGMIEAAKSLIIEQHCKY